MQDLEPDDRLRVNFMRLMEGIEAQRKRSTSLATILAVLAIINTGLILLAISLIVAER